MIKERMEIEQKYGKSLQNWHAKWALHVDTNVPSSIIKHLWLELLEEGRELSHAHLNVKDRCNDELVKTLEVFRKFELCFPFWLNLTTPGYIVRPIIII